MGSSLRFRLLGIFLVTLVLGWHFLRIGSPEGLEARKLAAEMYTKAESATMPVALSVTDEGKVSESDSSEKPAEDVKLRMSLEKIGKADMMKAKGVPTGAQAPESAAPPKNAPPVDVEAEDPSKTSTESGVSEADGPVKAKEATTSPINPVVTETSAEQAEKSKKEREKAIEKEKEDRKAHFVQAHDKKRDETTKEFATNPALRKRLNVTLEDIGIVMRTGDDIKHRLAGPLHTWASERTHDNLVIYSDLVGEFEGWKLHDAIEPWVDRPAIRDTASAKYWRETKQKKQQEKAGADLPTAAATKAKRFNGWNLDALKFVSSVQLGYHELRQKRDFKWYVFVDDDAYYHLSTLAKLLSNLDYEDEFYVGGVSYFGIAFAHGGAGAVASAGAMKKRFVDHAATVEAFHDIGATAQYGDTNLARAFEAIDIHYDHAFRESFNGENPFGRAIGHDLVCQHVVTFHHLPLEFFPHFHDRVKMFEELTYIKVLSALSDENRPVTDLWRKEDWTFNLDAKDVGKASEAANLRDNNWAYSVNQRYDGMLDARACGEMCRDSDKCVAWTYISDERTCSMSEWFRLGHRRAGSTSGIDGMHLAGWVDHCTPWWPRIPISQ